MTQLQPARKAPASIPELSASTDSVRIASFHGPTQLVEPPRARPDEKEGGGAMRKQSVEKPPGKNDDGPKHIVLKAVVQMIAYVVSRAIWDWLS